MRRKRWHYAASCPRKLCVLVVEMSLVLHSTELTNGRHSLFLAFPYCFVESLYKACLVSAGRMPNTSSPNPHVFVVCDVPLAHRLLQHGKLSLCGTRLRAGAEYLSFPDQETRRIWPRLQTGKRRSLARGGGGRTATLAAFCLTYRRGELALPVRVPRGSARHAPSRHSSR